MILKGNIRAGASELADHLMNTRDNDRVELAGIEGFASQDLHGALAEAYAVSAGTNCTKYLYSLSINPDQELTREQYARAIDKIGQKLGLADQPKAVVFHVKNGREHCHVAWSRIDIERMQAVHMPFDRQRLREIARDLVRDFGHDMPKYLGEDRGRDRFKDRFNAKTLAEQGQEQRSGISAEERRGTITKAYEMADNATAFRHALAEQGYILAQGDKRGQVVVDRAGDVHSLTRQIEGVTAKDIRSNLNLDAVQDLPSVQEAKEQIAVLARQNALEAVQERSDAPDRVQVAQDHLSALSEAHKAELKALKGGRADALKSIREEQAKQLDYVRQAVKEAYTPEWAAIFKRQREEMQAITSLRKSPVKRLKYILGHKNMDKTHEGAKGHLAKAFNWLTKTKPKDQIASLRQQLFPDDIKGNPRKMFAFVRNGEFDHKKLAKTHEKERRNLGDMQKLAERSEVQAIKADMADRRNDVQREHTETLRVLKASHADERAQALEQLELSRKIIEREGRDVSRGEKAEREGEAHGWGGGFARQGFGRQGFDAGQERDRDEDDERFIKPPGASFTP